MFKINFLVSNLGHFSEKIVKNVKNGLIISNKKR